MSNNNEFLKHLNEKLTEINGNYKYRINWYADIEKAKTEANPRIDIESKELFIVLTPQPSRSYGDSSIVQQLEITCMCVQSSIADAMDILSKYQDSSVNKKWWTEEGSLVNESWFSPSIQENFINFRVNKGAIISMNGSVTFTSDVVDIERVLLFQQWNKLYEFIEVTSADAIPTNTENSTRKKAKNRSLLYKIDLKCKNTSSIFCQMARAWKEGTISVNSEIPVKLIYTDNHEKDYSMVIISCVLTTTDGTIPTLSVSLMERM